MFTIDGQTTFWRPIPLLIRGRGSRSLVITAQLSARGTLTVRGGPENSLMFRARIIPTPVTGEVVRSYLQGRKRWFAGYW